MTAPTGWYDQGDGSQRYWDGTAWTEHTAPSTQTAPSTHAAPSTHTAQPAYPAPYAAAPAPPSGQLAVPPVAAPLAQPSGHAALPSVAPGLAPRKRVWPWVVGIVGGVLLLVIGWAIWGVMAFVGVVSGPVHVVNDFEGALESGDCVAMQSTITASFLATNGWDDCEIFKEDASYLTPSAFNANNSSIVNGTATVTADMSYAGETEAYVGTFTLIKQDGDWRVDWIEIDVKN